ncbi:MAG: hypothetical protein OQJ77_05310, partial [Thiovulaceae bacterium]|nr:hypothetical protein [Sulfurimonadaceae bacterium]
MQKLSNSSILKIISRLLILLVVAKVISLVVLYLLPSDGVELSVEESYQPKYQRVDFKNMLSTAQKVQTVKKELVQSGVSMTNMILKGLYGTKDSGFIIVALKSKPKKTTIVEKGDVYEGYTLVAIEKKSAIFTKNSTKYTLNLEDSKVVSKHVKSKAKKNKNNEESEEISQKIVSKSDIEHYAKNPKEIWKEISIVEVKDGKNIKGFKVT